jgi:hypothetical protein
VFSTRALLRRLSSAELGLLLRLMEPALRAGRAQAWQVILAALAGEELRRREHSR